MNTKSMMFPPLRGHTSNPRHAQDACEIFTRPGECNNICAIVAMDVGIVFMVQDNLMTPSRYTFLPIWNMWNDCRQYVDNMDHCAQPAANVTVLPFGSALQTCVLRATTCMHGGILKVTHIWLLEHVPLSRIGYYNGVQKDSRMQLTSRTWCSRPYLHWTLMICLEVDYLSTGSRIACMMLCRLISTLIWLFALTLPTWPCWMTSRFGPCGSRWSDYWIYGCTCHMKMKETLRLLHHGNLWRLAQRSASILFHLATGPWDMRNNIELLGGFWILCRKAYPRRLVPFTWSTCIRAGVALAISNDGQTSDKLPNCQHQSTVHRYCGGSVPEYPWHEAMDLFADYSPWRTHSGSIARSSLWNMDVGTVSQAVGRSGQRDSRPQTFTLRTTIVGIGTFNFSRTCSDLHWQFSFVKGTLFGGHRGPSRRRNLSWAPCHSVQWRLSQYLAAWLDSTPSTTAKCTDEENHHWAMEVWCRRH